MTLQKNTFVFLPFLISIPYTTFNLASVSIIIPVLNEAQTIAKVVQLVQQSPLTLEVIVIDDKSLDRTVEESKRAGAKVVTSTKLGKGASMRDGLMVAKGEYLLYLDGDIENYVPDIVERMIAPLQNNTADFVKSTFNREAGRVTEIVAKPLLSLLFPSLVQFSQPLSGIIAGKREFFEKLTFENDYGVDIGILIDMHLLGAKIQEVNIGGIAHKMKTWRELSPMSRQVSRAILRRASSLSRTNIEQLGSLDIIRDQMVFAVNESFSSLKKMVIFDMDNTLLQGRFIERAAEKFGFKKQLVEILTQHRTAFVATKAIAKLFQGVDIAKIIEVADEIQMTDHAELVVKRLKERGYIVGIITDSYDCVAAHFKHKLGADFALANELEFSHSVATGEVKIPSFFLHTDQSRCDHEICKRNALLHVAKKNAIDLANIIVVGDGDNDVCMAKSAGVGVAFCATEMMKLIADKRIDKPSLKPLLSFAH